MEAQWMHGVLSYVDYTSLYRDVPTSVCLFRDVFFCNLFVGGLKYWDEYDCGERQTFCDNAPPWYLQCNISIKVLIYLFMQRNWFWTTLNNTNNYELIDL